MTNLVFIIVTLTTNVIETADTPGANSKLRTNVVHESHAYAINGRQFYHVMPPTTNVVVLERKWVEAPAAASSANCVTRLWDGRTYAEAGGDTNNNGSLVSADMPPPMVRSRVDWETGKPLTAYEAAMLCLPPVPEYVQAMSKKPQ